MDITPKGGLRVPFGDEPQDVAAMKESCALDIAERGPVTLETIAQVQSITRERVRQIELTAMRRMQEALAGIMKGDDDYAGGKPVPLPTLEDKRKTLSGYQKKSAATRANVINWLSEVGSPPID